MSSVTTNRDPRTATGRPGPGLLASLAAALVPLVLLVPAGLPLCDPEVEACAITVPVAPAGAHCPMEPLSGASGSASMECCVRDATPPAPSPAVPAKSDPDLRAPSQVLAPALAAAPVLALLPTPSRAPAPADAPTAQAVPLYTLLSTLLN